MGQEATLDVMLPGRSGQGDRHSRNRSGVVEDGGRERGRGGGSAIGIAASSEWADAGGLDADCSGSARQSWSPDGGYESVVLAARATVGHQRGGNRPNANYFLLDGATNTDPTFNTQNLSASPDAIQEFKVQIGTYSADMGEAGGGQVNIVTRSGDNKLHGTVYEFLRNGALDAHSFNDMGGTKHLVQNNFGASLGGPVPIGKKTFFFVNYEGLRHVQADSMTETVPTEDEVNGDFRMSGVTIYDPATTVPNPNYNPNLPVSQQNPQFRRQPFPDNIIPKSRMNQVAVTMLTQCTPRPNMMMGDMGGMTMMGQPTVVGPGNDSNNYLDARNEVHYTDQGTARVDHQFGSKDTGFIRYSASGEHGFMPENLPGFGYPHDNRSQQGVGSYSHIFTPLLLNEATVAVSRLSMNHTTESANKNDIVGQLGIAGVGLEDRGPGAPRTSMSRAIHR